jgi:putative ABC transport system ATP-binding protein
MPEPAIKARGLVKWFGEGDARTMALRDVSIDASFGEMLYIVGPSGSGKTTLLSVLSGILRPDAGTVLLEGVDIWRLGGNELADLRLNKIGFVFQDYHLFPRLTTAENVAIPLILKRIAWSDAIREAMRHLAAVGLENRAELPPVKLSGGEQQRVAIARALANKPKLILADEPAGNLDSQTADTIVELLRTLAHSQDATVLLVTHDEAMAKHSDRTFHLVDGRLVEDDVAR